MCTLFLISTNLSTKSYFGEKLLWHIVDKIISWCHRWIPREEPGRNRQLLFLSLSFKCVQSVSLSHYAIGHTYFTEQMKVFSLLATSALWWFVSHQDDLKDMAWGERLSPLCTLWPIMWSHALMFLCPSVEEKPHICVDVCMYLSHVFWDMWSNKHADTLRDQSHGSKCQTWLIQQRCSDVTVGFPLSWTRHTDLGLHSSSWEKERQHKVQRRK